MYIYQLVLKLNFFDRAITYGDLIFIPLILKQVQQGLEMRGFWFQKKSVQLKTAFLEVTPM